MHQWPPPQRQVGPWPAPATQRAGGDALDSDASDFEGWQICDCAFCAMYNVLPAR
jgi:hypothetical protein